MTRILFVCHGNICRSPMAEYIMKQMVKDSHLEDDFEIASAATSTEELGNPVYPPARQKLAQHGISCKGHRARQVTRHEIIHAFLFESGLDISSGKADNWAVNEEMVDWFCIQIPKIQRCMQEAGVLPI